MPTGLQPTPNALHPEFKLAQAALIECICGYDVPVANRVCS